MGIGSLSYNNHQVQGKSFIARGGDMIVQTVALYITVYTSILDEPQIM